MALSKPLALLILAIMTAVPAAGQDRILDEGTLVIRSGGRVIGAESFTIRQLRGPDGRLAYRVTTRASYPPRRPRSHYVAEVNLGPDSNPVSARIDVLGNRPARFLARLNRRRTNIVTISDGAESSREYRGSATRWVVDDSTFALYALPPGASGAATLYDIRSGSHKTLGVRAGRSGPHGNRHLVVGSGQDRIDIWFNAKGQLQRVELPARNLVAVRR